MEYFAGLDVSLEETAICIINDTGLIVREARTASEPEALVAFFRASGIAMKRVGLEACSMTAWLHQALTEAGIAVICIVENGVRALLREAGLKLGTPGRRNFAARVQQRPGQCGQHWVISYQFNRRAAY